MTLSEITAKILERDVMKEVMVRGFDVLVEYDRYMDTFYAYINCALDRENDELLAIGILHNVRITALKTEIMDTIKQFPAAKDLIQGYKEGKVDAYWKNDCKPWDHIRL